MVVLDIVVVLDMLVELDLVLVLDMLVELVDLLADPPSPPVADPPVPPLPLHPWLAAPTATNAVTAANGPARCQNNLSLASVMLPPFD